jgi:fructoselysine and glucoselysine-specific PTS system IIA component
MNRKLLIATHSTFADGIRNAMELIAGTQDFVYTLCAYTGEITEVTTPVRRFISSLRENEELVVVTDLFGGSVNNEFMKYLSNPNVYLIAGVNLPLLFEIVTNFDTGDINELIEQAITNAKESIRYCNPLIHMDTTEDTF